MFFVELCNSVRAIIIRCLDTYIRRNFYVYGYRMRYNKQNARLKQIQPNSLETAKSKLNCSKHAYIFWPFLLCIIYILPIVGSVFFSSFCWFAIVKRCFAWPMHNAHAHKVINFIASNERSEWRRINQFCCIFQFKIIDSSDERLKRKNKKHQMMNRIKLDIIHERRCSAMVSFPCRTVFGALVIIYHYLFCLISLIII